MAGISRLIPITVEEYRIQERCWQTVGTPYEELVAYLAILLRNNTSMKDAINKIEKNWGCKPKNQRDWFRVTLSSIGDAVIATDTSGIITFLNPAAEQITGYQEAEALGLPIRDVFNIFDEATLEPAEIPLKTVIREGIVKDLANNTVLVSKSGRAHSVVNSAAPIRSDQGDNIGMVVVFYDVTETRRLQEKIARLDKLNVVAHLAAGFAHEIRNPMTTVRGYLQLLSLNEHFRDYNEHFQTMIGELDHANSIITGFLSLTKDSFMEINQCHLNSIIEAVVPLLQAGAVENTKRVNLELGEIPSLMLSGNAIRHLIINLAQNALEASPEGDHVTIRTYRQKDHVLLEVQDQGDGIDAKILPDLGAPFVTSKPNGTGLGLYSCYQIAHRHEASLEVKTSPAGTTVSVSFPLI